MKFFRGLLVAAAALLAAAPAQADFLFTAGAGNTAFDFTCFGSKHCFATVVTTSAGTEIFTSAAPAQVTGANGTFPATQSGTWTVQQGGAPWSVSQSGAWTVNPTTAANWGIGATAAAVPANAHYVGMAQGGNLVGMTGTSGNLNVQCANCSGSGVSTVDQASWTQGTSLFAGIGGVFNDTATLTTGQQGFARLTTKRAQIIDVDSTGNQLHTDLTSAIPAGTAYIGQVGLNAVGSGGWTPNHLVAAASNNSTNLKASAGVVHAVQGYGVGSAPAYIKLYDKATAPTCGTDTPVKVIMIPAASTAANGAGAVNNIIDVQFTTGIGFCVVTGITNADNISVAASTFLVEIDWK